VLAAAATVEIPASKVHNDVHTENDQQFDRLVAVDVGLDESAQYSGVVSARLHGLKFREVETQDDEEEVAQHKPYLVSG